MTYHLKNGISFRDYIAADVSTATAILKEAIINAGIRQTERMTTAALEETIEPCGRVMSSEGVEKCIVLRSEDIIAKVGRDPDKSFILINQFLQSLDREIEKADEQFYHKHVI